MKTLVINLNSVTPELLFGDEALVNLRQVMEIGCYGLLDTSDGVCFDGKAVKSQIEREGGRAITLNGDSVYPSSLESELQEATRNAPCDNATYAQSQKSFAATRHILESHQWDYFQLDEGGLSNLDNGAFREYMHYIDEEVGGILGLLDDETSLLIVSDSSFALAAPNNPLYGEMDGVRGVNIAPTLLELAGYEIPEAIQEESLVAGMELEDPSLSEDDEEALRERLTGLGYIG